MGEQPGLDLIEIVATLARLHAPPAQPAEPLQLILWENVGYLIDDERRRALFDAFGERVGFDAALVSLDLAALYARQGRTDEVKRLATEMVPIFESRDVHQEALAALLLFREAAEAEQVTLGLVDRIVTFLQRARLDPELRFQA